MHVLEVLAFPCFSRAGRPPAGSIVKRLHLIPKVRNLDQHLAFLSTWRHRRSTMMSRLWRRRCNGRDRLVEWGCDLGYRPPSFQYSFVSFSSESEQQPPDDSATIIQGPSLLASTGVHRSSPSMFHLPGLRSLPFWTAPGPSVDTSSSQRRHRIAFNDPMITAAVQHVESTYDDIRSEYFNAVLGQGNDTNPRINNISKPLEPDYDVASKGGEHAEDALHSGTWDWHSYDVSAERR